MKQKEKIIPIPSYMRDKLEYVKNSNLDILYQNGKIIVIPLTNIELIVPHIITFKSKNNELKLLYYGDMKKIEIGFTLLICRKKYPIQD